MADTTKKFLSLAGLEEYDALIKQEIVDAVSTKANASHNHDDRYYTETEIDSKISAVNTSITNITNGTTTVKNAEHAESADEATHAASADTATKATQDSAGQQINTTYIKSLSASGKNLTYTKGNGTTATINIQPSTVNVTFSASEWSESNSLYTQTVTASNISADDEPELVTNKSTSMSTDDIKAYNKAFNYLCEGTGETGDGTVTWVCLNKPEIDITVGLKM